MLTWTLYGKHHICLTDKVISILQTRSWSSRKRNDLPQFYCQKSVFKAQYPYLGSSAHREACILEAETGA